MLAFIVDHPEKTNFFHHRFVKNKTTRKKPQKHKGNTIAFVFFIAIFVNAELESCLLQADKQAVAARPWSRA